MSVNCIKYPKFDYKVNAKMSRVWSASYQMAEASSENRVSKFQKLRTRFSQQARDDRREKPHSHLRNAKCSFLFILLFNFSCSYMWALGPRWFSRTSSSLMSSLLSNIILQSVLPFSWEKNWILILWIAFSLQSIHKNLKPLTMSELLLVCIPLTTLEKPLFKSNP